MSKRRLTDRQRSRVDERRQGQVDHLPTQAGLVIMNSGRKALIRLDDDSLHSAHQRANLDTIVAGDRVLVSLDEQHGCVVESLLPRQSLLSRPGFRGVIKPMAANVDQLLVVMAPAPGIDLDLLDRSLCYCAWQGLETVIVLNKIDLLPDELRPLTDELATTYRAMGYRWLETSPMSGAGMSDFAQSCRDHTSVFVGNSGVGKSSLAQALLPDIAIRTQSLSQATGMGQHTTNNATLYDLPQGGQLIDAAGIRSLNLAEFAIQHPDRYWRDFAPFLGQCRFHNCTHTHEPDCAIRSAVASGQIAEHRYDHYVRLLSDSENKSD